MSNLHQPNLDSLKQRLSVHPPHLQVILNGAVASLADTNNPLRFTNTATALRELLRELFASILPDAKIERCSWFTPHPDAGVTRQHRTLFAVYSYLAPDHFPTDFVSSIEVLAGQISRQAGDLSAFTHVTAAVLAAPEQRAIDTFDSTIGRFLELKR